MNRTQLKTLVAIVTFALVASAADAVRACSVPVFRYALERWVSDPFQVVVFHRGELPGELEPVAEAIRSNGLVEQTGANVQFRFVDLAGSPDPQLQRLWDLQQTESLPWMVVLYPPTARIVNPVVWSGPFAQTEVDRLLDSPLRREIAQRSLKGETAVWVLLESGDKQADDAASAVLAERLNHAEETLELPDIEDEDIESGLLEADPAELRIDFSMLRLSRDDPAEKLFVDMLLGSEDDLREFDLPMAFPVFGRGRVLYALVGTGINEETIDQACAELIGPCTCQVKDQNPGMDLLMSVHWNDLVVPQMRDDKPLPPLSGPGDLLAENSSASPAENGTGSTASGDAQASTGQEAAQGRDSDGTGDAVDSESPADARAASAGSGKEPEERASGIVRNSFLLIGLCAAGVIAVSLFLAVRKG